MSPPFFSSLSICLKRWAIFCKKNVYSQGAPLQRARRFFCSFSIRFPPGARYRTRAYSQGAPLQGARLFFSPSVRVQRFSAGPDTACRGREASYREKSKTIQHFLKTVRSFEGAHIFFFLHVPPHVAMAVELTYNLWNGCSLYIRRSLIRPSFF